MIRSFEESANELRFFFVTLLSIFDLFLSIEESNEVASSSISNRRSSNRAGDEASDLYLRAIVLTVAGIFLGAPAVDFVSHKP